MNDELQTVTVRIPRRIVQAVERTAKDRGCTRSDIVRLLLIEAQKRGEIGTATKKK